VTEAYFSLDSFNDLLSSSNTNEAYKASIDFKVLYNSIADAVLSFKPSVV
jgi:hypothetical protein